MGVDGATLDFEDDFSREKDWEAQCNEGKSIGDEDEKESKEGAGDKKEGDDEEKPKHQFKFKKCKNG